MIDGNKNKQETEKCFQQSGQTSKEWMSITILPEIVPAARPWFLFDQGGTGSASVFSVFNQMLEAVRLFILPR
ncbi:hypothetical protein [Angelakisella massiliensis]|uniref:hypothetical protein n=1 Tax=Angelakisella massiliensis TaxID=1871018 RepID=UPI0023A7F577|nr:hypothetical protein [Angelakisella massiliensis]